MAATGELKERIQLLQAAKARAEALGKTLKPEAQRELDSYQAQGLLGKTAAASGGGGGGVEQGNANAFLIRALGANKTFTAQKIGSRSAIGNTVAEYLPSLSNQFSSDERQVSEAAKREFIAATLRKDSGAAITPDEFDLQNKVYFPQPGDGEAAVNEKAAARKRVIQGLISSAGSAVPDSLKAQYPEYFGQAKGGDQQSGTAGVVAGGSGTPPSGPETPSGTRPRPQNSDVAGATVQFAGEGPAMQANARKFTDEQWQQFQQAAMSGASVDRLAGMSEAFGAKPDAQALANIQEIVAFYAKPENRKFPLSVDYKRGEVKPVAVKGEGATAATLRGVADVATVGALPYVGAAIDTITNPNSTFADNVDRNRGILLNDEQQHGTARLIGQVAGGALIPSGAAGAARTAGIAALRSGVTRGAAELAAARAFAARTAQEASAYGGVYGFNSADGDVLDRLGAGAAGAGIGAVAGGATAYGGSRIAQVLRQRAAARGVIPATDGQEVLAAAERQNIVPFPADVGGGATRRATSAAAQTIGGNGQIVRGARATLDSAEAVRNRVAAAIGPVEGVEATGETARQGVNAYRARTSARIGRIYDAAEQAAGTARIETPEALRVLDGELGALQESPVQGAGVSILQGLRDQLATGAVTVRGLRNARTVLREEFENNGLRRSNTERIADRVLDAATDDIVNGLRAQGLDRAATQYRVADRMWRERAATIDEFLEPIVGGTGAKAASGEQIVQRLKSAMSGNNRRFVGFLNALPPEEQSSVRASLISRLGQATAGQQDETGQVFSLSTFLSNWNAIGDSAKNRLFGTEGRAALNDLARYAAGSKEAQRYANHSNTAGAGINWWTAMSGAGAWGTLGATVIGENLTGRLLASPRFARWLARAPRATTPQQRQTQFERLSRIARAEPAIANDIVALQSRLAEAFGGAPTRLAADERRDEVLRAEGNTAQENSQGGGAQP